MTENFSFLKFLIDKKKNRKTEKQKKKNRINCSKQRNNKANKITRSAYTAHPCYIASLLCVAV